MVIELLLVIDFELEKYHVFGANFLFQLEIIKLIVFSARDWSVQQKFYKFV